jgi:hypothetical protein
VVEIIWRQNDREKNAVKKYFSQFVSNQNSHAPIVESTLKLILEK